MSTRDTTEIKRFIRTHIGELRGIQDIADHFGMTADALRMRWKRSGETMPVGRFIDQCRLDILIEHIANGALCFEAIASSGFRDRSTAFRCFRETTGLSMRVFRRFSSRLTKKTIA